MQKGGRVRKKGKQKKTEWSCVVPAVTPYEEHTGMKKQAKLAQLRLTKCQSMGFIHWGIAKTGLPPAPLSGSGGPAGPLPWRR